MNAGLVGRRQVRIRPDLTLPGLDLYFPPFIQVDAN
jgi:hypothetical protein